MACKYKLKNTWYTEEELKSHLLNNPQEVLQILPNLGEMLISKLNPEKLVVNEEKVPILQPQEEIPLKQEVIEQPIQNKEGIDFVFENNPELAKIGSKEQYSQYLDTIFPDSKVKDIVYHGTDSEFDKFNKSLIGKKSIKTGDLGIFFSDDKEVVEQSFLPKKIISSILNIKNPNKLDWQTYMDNILDSPEKIEKKGYDAIIGEKTEEPLFNQRDKSSEFAGNSFIVFEPEQIHILGSKQDIEGFKKFVEQPINKEIKPNEVIPLTTNFSRESVKNDNDYLYLFTDNAKRTSGNNTIGVDSWYRLKYTGKYALAYPTMTQAVVRGLNNAFPITTMVDDNRTQWKDSQFEEYKKIIDDEINTIKEAQAKFKGIKFAAQMPFGQGKISNMKQSAPKIWNYLNEKLAEIGIDNTGEIPKVINQPTEIKPKIDSSKKIENPFKNSKIQQKVYHVDVRTDLNEKTLVDDLTMVLPTGVFFTDNLKYAQRFAKDIDGKIYEAYINAENPIGVDKDEIQYYGRHDLEKLQKEGNYDSAIYYSDDEMEDKYGAIGHEIVVYKPEQIKLTQEQPIVEETKEELPKLPDCE